jgi:UDP-N-acetylglucosamine 2-epimerase (non-hydrolysing)
MNPNVRQTVMATLAGSERIYLTEPLDYITFINLMRHAHLVLTDSGGVQEEAPTLRKPLLVLRKLTERPEAFQAGLSKVVGTDQEAIVAEASCLLSNDAVYSAMTSGSNPYGDGRAAERIADVLCRWSRGRHPLLESEQEFQPVININRRDL